MVPMFDNGCEDSSIFLKSAKFSLWGYLFETFYLNNSGGVTKLFVSLQLEIGFFKFDKQGGDKHSKFKIHLNKF